MTAASWENQLTHYLPWFSTALLGAYVIYKLVRKDQRCEWVNKSIQKDQPKVVNVIDIEDIDKKTVYCRCWRTKTVCCVVWILESVLFNKRNLDVSNCLGKFDFWILITKILGNGSEN